MLRPVAPDETRALAKMWHDGWRIGHLGIVPEGLIAFRDVDQFHDRIRASMDDCFVAGPPGGITGFVRLRGAELDQFYVAPSQIGRGVARPLIEAAEELLRSLGVHEAHLIASVGNDRAIRFYEKCGWRNCGQQIAGVETAAGPFELEVVRLEKTL